MRKEGVLKKNNKKYPKLLKKIPDAPATLFWRGNFNEEIFRNTLAVVGSRRMTGYGKRVAEELVGEIASREITVVSGFMYGIDAAAHRIALEVGGKTIAVLPCGADIIHPSFQKDIFYKILRQGLILSEYKKGSLPAKWTYIQRNRIVAGLSKATLLIEAARESGSLITAELTLGYKRKLFAVPGSIFSPVSEGTNDLIKKGVARPVLCADDILSFFKKESGQEYREKDFLSGKEGKVYSFLKNEPSGPDAISEEAKIPINEVSAILSLLEIKGMIKSDGQKYYVN